MTDIGLRLNLDSEEVELVVDGQVAMTSGADVFRSWVDAVNAKRTLATPLTPEHVTPVQVVEQTTATVVPTPEPTPEPVPAPAPVPEPTPAAEPVTPEGEPANA